MDKEEQNTPTLFLATHQGRELETTTEDVSLSGTHKGRQYGHNQDAVESAPGSSNPPSYSV